MVLDALVSSLARLLTSHVIARSPAVRMLTDADQDQE